MFLWRTEMQFRIEWKTFLEKAFGLVLVLLKQIFIWTLSQQFDT